MDTRLQKITAYSLLREQPSLYCAPLFPVFTLDKDRRFMAKAKKVVLAYSGGLDTSIILRWLQVEKNCEVKLTKDPDGRAAMGNSSGGSAALIMAWYRTNLYHRVLTTSGTFVNQQWPFNPETPGGAWDFHETLIPNSPKKPIRIFISVGDRDLLNPNVMRDGMHDWSRPTTEWPRC